MNSRTRIIFHQDGPLVRRRGSDCAMSSISRLIAAVTGWLFLGPFSPAALSAHAAAEFENSSAPNTAMIGQASGISTQPTDPSEPQQTANERTPVQGPALTVPREIIDMLDQRKRDLDRREASLRGAEDRLLVLKGELEQILTKHERLAAAQQQKEAENQQRQQERKLRQEKTAADSQNQHQAQLAKIYESMPAEEAAASLERMPERKAIEVLRILKSKSAGAILAAVRPERAARLTEQLLAAP
jgi:flagellar motility protein MotE (MotC chaperone)